MWFFSQGPRLLGRGQPGQDHGAAAVREATYCSQQRQPGPWDFAVEAGVRALWALSRVKIFPHMRCFSTRTSPPVVAGTVRPEPEPARHGLHTTRPMDGRLLPTPTIALLILLFYLLASRIVPRRVRLPLSRNSAHLHTVPATRPVAPLCFHDTANCPAQLSAHNDPSYSYSSLPHFLVVCRRPRCSTCRERKFG